MKLLIKDFSKIHEATIEFNGITVIAGNNNTGKSTVGKILFALFNSVNDIDKKVELEKEEAIQGAAFDAMNLFFHDIEITHSGRILPPVLRRNKFNNIEELIDNVVEFSPVPISNTEKRRLKETIQEKVADIKAISDDVVKKQIIEDYFKDLFNGQINSISKIRNREKNEAKAKLSLRRRTVQVNFEKNVCKNFKQTIHLLNKAIYIDDPFVVDAFLGNRVLPEFFWQNGGRSAINRALSKYLRSSSKNNVVDRIIANNQLDEIYKILSTVIKGEFASSNHGEVFLNSTLFTDNLKLSNLSTGIKAFVILKKLIEDNVIKNRDVLILDEPEIHLHPEWQIIYAELIVLLQKKFELTLLLTTHSPYFLRAIEVFSEKYDMKNQCKYYLLFDKESQAYFKDVTGNVSEAYEKMASAFDILNTIDDENRSRRKADEDNATRIRGMGSTQSESN